MIVSDTNLIAYVLIEGEYTSLAERALLKDPEWAAPRLWRSEFRNLLATYFRRGLLTLGDCLRSMDEAERLMGQEEFEVSSERVLTLAASSLCSAYDCEFVALAEGLGVPMVTADAQLARAFPSVVIPLKRYVS